MRTFFSSQLMVIFFPLTYLIDRSISKQTLDFLERHLSASANKKKHQQDGTAMEPCQAVVSEMLKLSRAKWEKARMADGKLVLVAITQVTTACDLLQWCPSECLADFVLFSVVPALLDGIIVQSLWACVLFMVVTHSGISRFESLVSMCLDFPIPSFHMYPRAQMYLLPLALNLRVPQPHH